MLTNLHWLFSQGTNMADGGAPPAVPMQMAPAHLPAAQAQAPPGVAAGGFPDMALLMPFMQRMSASVEAQGAQLAELKQQQIVAHHAQAAAVEAARVSAAQAEEHRLAIAVNSKEWVVKRNNREYLRYLTLANLVARCAGAHDIATRPVREFLSILMKDIENLDTLNWRDVKWNEREENMRVVMKANAFFG